MITAPAATHTSPTEKTFDSGNDLGMAKISPRNDTFGDGSAIEFEKWISGEDADRPAVARAWAEAGITPPLEMMATRLSDVPRAMSHIPGIRRLATRKPTAKK